MGSRHRLDDFCRNRQFDAAQSDMTYVYPFVAIAAVALITGWVWFVRHNNSN